MTLTENYKLIRASNAAAAAQTLVTGSTIDCKGFDSATFIVAFGTITATAVTSIKVQGGDESDASDMADLLGTSVSVAADDDNQLTAVEIVQPRFRYLRVMVVRGTADAVVDGAICLLGRPKTAPVTHDAATVVGTEIHLAPAAGTA